MSERDPTIRAIASRTGLDKSYQEALEAAETRPLLKPGEQISPDIQAHMQRMLDKVKAYRSIHPEDERER